MLDILIHPDPQLRVKCRPVTDITPQIRTLLADMAETMYAAPGIGLAAPQVGSEHRLLVLDVGDDEESARRGRLYKLINPEIRSRSGKTESEEGCLSIPGIRETIKRSASVVVQGVDESGNDLTIEAEGLLAICLQHEIDHLDGILFIDHLSRLKQQLVKAKYSKLRSAEHE